MSKLQIPFSIWVLRTFFLSIAYCVTLFQQVQPAAVTDPIEVIALKSLAEKWSTDLKTSNSNTWKTPWNLTGDPCTGRAIDSTPITDTSMNPAFKCDCTFNNGNTCRITQLKASEMDITGQIPPELANLTQIWDLNFQNNYLTGTIPAFIGNLTRMQYLSVGTNNLSGPVPKELGNLRSLISLSFSSNNLNGSLPPELGSLTALEQLYIDSAGVSGEIPSSFRNLKSLKILWASDNQFTGGIPDFIGSWKNLTDLRLQGNAFKGPIPSRFSNLTSLTNLRVSDIAWPGVSSLSFLKNLKKLTTLVLRNNMISGEIPSYIGEFTGLQSLDLSFNNFTGGIPDSLQNLSTLTILLLGDNSLSGKLPSQKTASLTYLDLSYNQFSGALPGWLNSLTVNLVGNYFATNETDNRFSGRGLGCLQRTFPCNGAPRYSRFAINCGGGQKIFAIGDAFEPDTELLDSTSFYVSNTQTWGVSYAGRFMDNSNATYTATNHSEFTKTLNSELYETARLSPSSLRYYGLGLENGPYTVKLRFAEIQIENSHSWKSIGRRLFDVYVQGQKVLTDFDIRKEAGGSNIGVVKYFNKTSVTANFLEIHLFWAGKGTCCTPAQGTYGPLVSAISVTPEFNPKKSKTGMVIGITTGLVAALICIILFSLLWRRRRRVQKPPAADVEEDKGIDKRFEDSCGHSCNILWFKSCNKDCQVFPFND